ncbi:hypothetical protein FRB95_012412 [Tulasnella sp. JGI-2019a]|nr:hypothetical protein FRB95_012412 [Tulasnella sp. JGI-2019a]
MAGEIKILASRRPLWKRMVNYDRDVSTLSALKQKVVDIIVGIQLETVVTTGHEVDVISRKQDSVHADQQAIIQQLDLVYQEQQVLIRMQQVSGTSCIIIYLVLMKNDYLQDAEIDRLIVLLGSGDSGASKKPPCLEGTRASLLKWITQWIEAPPVDDKRGLCLIGAAGRGKSAVGASVAEAERALERLGADFYFTTDQQDRNMGVIPVLARQLALWGDRRLRVEIACAVDSDRDITQRTLEVQFKKLILAPLQTLADDSNCPPLVVLLDGLDECNNDYVSRLLDLIGQSFATLPAAVRFIITSRPEPHLRHHYASEPLYRQLYIRSLDSEKVGEMEMDIKAFFKRELPRMVLGMVKKPLNWPDEERLQILVRLSGSLWIWAVTVARMLADQNFRDPEKQLDTLISSAPQTDEEYGHNTDLYALYSMILNRACPPDSHSGLLALFRDVLGALCVVKGSINTHTLTSLICLDHSNSGEFIKGVRTKVLGYLQAVLVVPDVDDDDPSRDAKPITFVHKSFKDHLTNETRCDPLFLVNIAEQHRRMAIRCLRRMEDLKKPNICNIDSAMLNSEIGKNGRRNSDGRNSSGGRGINDKTDDEGRNRISDDNRGEGDGDINQADIDDKRGENSASRKREESLDIKGLVRRHISSALKYACENWANHVSCTPPECDDVYVFVDTFARVRLLYWLEVLSLLKMTGTVAESVESIEVWLKARPQQPPLPHRIATFITEVLGKTQVGIHLRRNMVHMASGPLPLRALDHAKPFLADVLPIKRPDVSLQASAMPRESDISTLSLLQDLKNFIVEFEDPITTSTPHIYHSALPFTPSHTSLSQVYGHLAEGGPKAWRGCLQQWSQRSAQNCLAWSPDGQRIISGSKDGTLCLWDPSTGAQVREARKIHPSEVHAYEVECVAWSPDGKLIISGSWNRESMGGSH